MATSGQCLPPMEHISSVNQSQVKMSLLTFKKAMHFIARQCNPPGIGRVVEGQQHWQTHWNVAESDSLTQIWGQCAGHCSTNTGATHKTSCSLICFLSLISVNTKCYFKASSCWSYPICTSNTRRAKCGQRMTSRMGRCLYMNMKC